MKNKWFLFEVKRVANAAVRLVVERLESLQRELCQTAIIVVFSHLWKQNKHNNNNNGQNGSFVTRLATSEMERADGL